MIATSSCGRGPKFDPANTDGAKDEDVVLLIMGEDPATSTAAGEN